MTSRPLIEASGLSDSDALIAVLAWERCQEMAARARDDTLRECWLKDAELAWERVERWLSQGNA